MSEDAFYNNNWKLLQRKYPLVAQKLEFLLCNSIDYEEFENLKERVSELETVLGRTKRRIEK